MDISRINILGASISVIILTICSLIFIFRLLDQQTVEYWLGIVLLLTAIPLFYLLFRAYQFQRPTIYYIQIGIMIGFLIIELFLDYVFKLEFRDVTLDYNNIFNILLWRYRWNDRHCLSSRHDVDDSRNYSVADNDDFIICSTCNHTNVIIH